MNHIYRLVWNHTLGALVAVADIARSKHGGPVHRGSSRTRLRPLSKALLLVLGLAPAMALAQPPAGVSLQLHTAPGGIPTGTQPVVAAPSNVLPVGGRVVSGQTAISQTGNTLSVDQSSQNTIIDWQSFDIGAGYTVTFQQPDSSSVALNRVLGTDPSAIYGHLDANGQVFLVNPYGIYFAPGARVDVGGIVASTLDITDQDFLNANYHFASNSTAGVRNDGSINSATGGYVAFIGANVSNNGSIATPEGTTGLGAGDSVDLTLAGNSLLSFKVSGSALDALAQNGGVIAANGGTVILSAQARDALLQTVVNNTGVIQAQTVASHDGTIELLGGDSGTTQVDGTLDASAPTTGDGGTIETSGAYVDIASGATITAASASGTGGSWLIDPVDLTIDANAATAIGTALNAGTSVTEQTTATGTSNSGSTNAGSTNSGLGDINVDASINWTTGNATLTLSAYHSLNINAPITATSSTGKLVLVTNNNAGGTSSGGTLNIAAPVDLNAASKLSINGINYTIIDSISALQAIGSNSTTLTGHYALAANLDDSNQAFTPIGTSTNAFTGIFEGLNHTISNLYINQAFYAGLFGAVGTNGVVRDVGLAGGSVSGIKSGALVGTNQGTIINAYASSSMSNGDEIGGLVGVNNGTISDSHATGNVSGGGWVGGLVGDNFGTISDSYATGSVTGSNGSVSNLGGLVGANSGSIDNAYATGNVSINAGSTNTLRNAGGLVGRNGGTISNAYATGDVSGNTLVGGLVGQAYGGIISNAYATGSVSGTNSVGGLVGSNASTVNNGYWDVTTTGTSNGYGSSNGSVTGGGGLTTAQLAATLPSGFSSADWTNDNNQTTPYLVANEAFSTVSGNVILGSDTSATPTTYGVIQNLTQLQNINTTGLADNYVLATDLDATATSTWNSGAGFAPIGNATTAFTGIFEGLNHTISHLTINRSSTGDVGLFGSVGQNGVVRNVGLVGASITGSFDTGALVGSIFDGTVSNAYATSTVTGTNNVGGLVGSNTGGTISNAYATATVIGTTNVGGLVGNSALDIVVTGHIGTIANAYATGSVHSVMGTVGGLVGNNAGTISNAHAGANISLAYVPGSYPGGEGGLVGLNSGSIDNAYATGTVTGSFGNSDIGGLVGANINGSISNAYATGDVFGPVNVGGLVGANSNGTVSNAYATGSVFGSNSNIGGLLGISSSGSVDNVYATGAVTGPTATGALIGNNRSSISNGYWDTTVTGTLAGIGSNNGGTTTGGGGLTTSQLADALPSGFSSSVWGNAGNQTTPYLLVNASFSTVSGSVILGTDTSATPTYYNVILTLDQLQNINSTGLGLDYVLGTDIDASATSTWNSGAGFVPFGTNYFTNAFTGVFDGLGFTVSNLTINRPSASYVGLFGVVGSGGVVRNIGVTGGSVTGSYSVGALVGANLGTITDAYATSNVTGNSIVGGLVGLNTNGAISNAYATGNVTGAGNYEQDIGGLVGYNSNGSISNAYATGNVTGKWQIGGLVGLNSNSSTISDVYATGNVIGTNEVGGLVGSDTADSTITNAYAIGSVSGTNNIGALVGLNRNGAVITNGYWDTSTGLGTGIGSNNGATVTGGGGLTSAQMLQQSSFTGFDFSSPVWVIYNGHTTPLLNVFLTPLTVTAPNQSQVYTGGTFGLLNPSYSVAGADTSGHLFGLGDPYNGAVNVGTYSPDLWSDQQGYRIIYSGAALSITPKQLTVTVTGNPTKNYDGTTDATLTSSDFLLSGFVSGQGATINQTSGTYANAGPGTGIGVSATLGSSDFTADSGTLLSNYILPAQATGAGTILAVGSSTNAPSGSANDPVLQAATSTGSQSATQGYAGIDAFALLLDPRMVYSLSAPGQPTAVQLTVQQSSETSSVSQPCSHGTLDPFAAAVKSHCRKH